MCFLVVSGLFGDCLMSFCMYLLTHMYSCGSCFFFGELTFNINYFLAKFMFFLVLLCFDNVLRCVVLAVRGLFGACLFVFFCKIHLWVCLFVVPDFCCTLSVHFLYFWQNLCLLFYLLFNDHKVTITPRARALACPIPFPIVRLCPFLFVLSLDPCGTFSLPVSPFPIIPLLLSLSYCPFPPVLVPCHKKLLSL